MAIDLFVICKDLAPFGTSVAWEDVVEEERSDLLKDFFRLTENQRKILIYIARGKTGNLYSNEVAKVMDIPISSISRALNSLIEGDYIEKTKTVNRHPNRATRHHLMEPLVALC